MSNGIELRDGDGNLWYDYTLRGEGVRNMAGLDRVYTSLVENGHRERELTGLLDTTRVEDRLPEAEIASRRELEPSVIEICRGLGVSALPGSIHLKEVVPSIREPQS